MLAGYLLLCDSIYYVPPVGWGKWHCGAAPNLGRRAPNFGFLSPHAELAASQSNATLIDDDLSRHSRLPRGDSDNSQTTKGIIIVEYSRTEPHANQPLPF